MKPPTVNTGGKAGQILDHLLCASESRIRRQDAQDLLQLFAEQDAEIANLRAEIARLLHNCNALADECLQKDIEIARLCLAAALKED